MTYLLDTNVISQFIARRPAENVLQWITEHQASGLYLSSVTIGEIQKGIAVLPESGRRDSLHQWLHGRLLVEYDDYILPVNRETMLHWGDMSARLQQLGKPMPVMDSLIAATALQHQLVLVTRNSADFKNVTIGIVNPWQA